MENYQEMEAFKLAQQSFADRVFRVIFPFSSSNDISKMLLVGLLAKNHSHVSFHIYANYLSQDAEKEKRKFLVLLGGKMFGSGALNFLVDTEIDSRSTAKKEKYIFCQKIIYKICCKRRKKEYWRENNWLRHWRIINLQ